MWIFMNEACDNRPNSKLLTDAISVSSRSPVFLLIEFTKDQEAILSFSPQRVDFAGIKLEAQGFGD